MKIVVYFLLLTVVVVSAGIYVFTYQSINNQISTLFVRNNDAAVSTQNISQKSDPFRKPGSETPLKATQYWKTPAKYERDKDEVIGLKEARVIRVINPLLEYEIVFLSTGIHKIITITPETEFFVPKYTYNENKEIIAITYSSANDREILNILEKDALIQIFIPSIELLSDDKEFYQIKADWLVVAD